MKRKYFRKNRLAWLIAFAMIVMLIFNNTKDKHPAATDVEKPSPVQIPVSTEVTYNDLQLFYLLLHSGLSFEEIIYSLNSYSFIFDDSSSNSSYQVRIGYDAEVIKRYHAKEGESIEIKYPRIRKQIGEPTYPYLEYFVYKLDANRHYELIQLFPIDGYASSYWSHREIGTFVREWPPRDGIDEYTIFDSVEETMK